MRAPNKGSRTGSRSHPCAQFTRFTAEENDKLVKLCRKRKLTVQAFMHAAAMRALNEAMLGKRTELEIINEHEERTERQRIDDARAPRGLGIRERLLAAVEEETDDADEYEAAPPTPPAPQPPVFTHAADQVMTLARTIVEAPQSARRDIWRAACHTLTLGRSREEALQLADELDAAIKRLGDAPKTMLEKVRARAK